MSHYLHLAAIAGLYLFVSSMDYQDQKEMEARMAKLPPASPVIAWSNDPVKDFGPYYSKCLTDPECEAIEAAWEAAHEANER